MNFRLKNNNHVNVCIRWPIINNHISEIEIIVLKDLNS